VESADESVVESAGTQFGSVDGSQDEFDWSLESDGGVDDVSVDVESSTVWATATGIVGAATMANTPVSNNAHINIVTNLSPICARYRELSSIVMYVIINDEHIRLGIIPRFGRLLVS
jgi:hypothetical protein